MWVHYFDVVLILDMVDVDFAYEVSRFSLVLTVGVVMLDCFVICVCLCFVERVLLLVVIAICYLVV